MDNEYSRTAASGCSFPPAKEWDNCNEYTLKSEQVQKKNLTPKQVALHLAKGPAKRFLEAGLTVGVWSEAPGIEPALDTYDGPERYTRAIYNHKDGKWETSCPAPPVTVYWGVWVAFGGRVAKPTKLLALWNAGASGRSGAAKGGSGTEKGAAGPEGSSQTPRPAPGGER